MLRKLPPPTVALPVAAAFRRPSPGPLRLMKAPPADPPLPQGEGRNSMGKTALSFWERGNRAAVGEGQGTFTVRHRNCEKQYQIPPIQTTQK